MIHNIQDISSKGLSGTHIVAYVPQVEVKPFAEGEWVDCSAGDVPRVLKSICLPNQ